MFLLIFLLILVLAWEADFVALILLIQDALGKQILTLFTVIPLILLILGRAWEADFDAIYGDPAHFADLRTRLGSRF